ncbi:hypothetical protein HK405_002592, partial [Cladochytrium tenue]
MFGFSVPIYFVTFREATEAAIVVSVLIAFVHQAFPHDSPARKRMSFLVWLGTALGLLISMVIGVAFLVV